MWRTPEKRRRGFLESTCRGPADRTCASPTAPPLALVPLGSRNPSCCFLPCAIGFSSRHRGGRQSARESPGSQSCRCGSCEKRITQCRMLPSLDVEAIRLDDAGHDIRQRCIARNGPENFLASDRMGTRPPARVDGDGIHNLSVNSCFEPAKADVGGLMVAAACGATRPVNREGIHGRTYFFLEGLGEGDGPALRFDESEITIIRSNASHQSARKRGGADR